MELTKKERYIISNQLKILEALFPDEASYYAEQRKAVEYGYELHYSWLTENIDDDVLTEDECKEIVEILNMYRAITFSYNKFENKSDIKRDKIRFIGFDGNEETKQYSYVNYFIIDLDRFKELRNDSEYPDFNSHSPMLDRYRKMLQQWKSFSDKNNLTEDQIKSILEK